MTPKETRQLRVAAGLTQTQLAALMGLAKRGQVTVSEWEHGVRNITEPHGRLLQVVCAQAMKDKEDGK